MQVQLPKTDFPMKGNLAQTEPARIASWQDARIYEKIVNRPYPKGLFVLPDGPPYANGNIHVGHVLNKVLKDIIIKYKNMSGYKAAFIPGWDCHGLPIELNVTKKLGPKRKDMSDTEIRKLCREEALSWVAKQRTQFQRLGVLADWEHPYLTLQPEYEAAEIRVLAKILENGVFYRGNKPVYWDPALQTALAAAEIEYKQHKSPSIYVKFELPGDFANVPHKKKSLVIWTTTPWTLPANYGIAVNADFEYGFFELNDEIVIIAKDMQSAFEKDTGIKLKLLTTQKGSTFENLKAKHPFMHRDSIVVLGEHVTLEAGTGVVHTAPGHGLEDYAVGLRYGLPVHSPVDAAGRFTADVPIWQGLSIWDANPKIIAHLEEIGSLLFTREIEHQYAYSPRSKAPLIFRATPQWFIRMDDEKYPVRKKCLEAAERDITYVPQWGIQRLTGMLANSPDWCLSRQRIWGVPIPVFYCTNCETPLADSEVMNRLANVMETSGEGIEAYHTRSTAEFTHGKSCSECKHEKFKPGKDILDVWFDSGVCHTAVQKRRREMAAPADVYLEGSDQHRGWFQTSLVSAMAADGEPPFKALITHGFVTDAQGYKMSKSVGNTVDPAEIIKESGAEILRLWVSHEDYGQDLTISKEMISRISDTYRRFRNTIRFLLGNLNDFDPSKDQVSYQNLTPLDRWALNQLHNLILKCTSAYDAYEFYKVYHALNNFFAHELSATYLDILKDRLYTGKAHGLPRRGAQTVLNHILRSLCGLMAPIASFLAEETYAYVPGERRESIFLTEFPTAPQEWADANLARDFSVLLEVRDAVSKELEDLRRQKVIGSSLDAQIVIHAPQAILKVLEAYTPHLREFFIVSQVAIQESQGSMRIAAGKADGIKCERCWHYDINTGTDANYPGVCPKCIEALK